MKKIFPCVIGLGYVGLPVFISLKNKFQVIGYDVNKNRVNKLAEKEIPITVAIEMEKKRKNLE